MISSAVSFAKTSNSSPKDEFFSVFHEMSIEIMLLLINNVHDKSLGDAFTTYGFAVVYPLLATSAV